jgi:hypothetical protein
MSKNRCRCEVEGEKKMMGEVEGEGKMMGEELPADKEYFPAEKELEAENFS